MLEQIWMAQAVGFEQVIPREPEPALRTSRLDQPAQVVLAEVGRGLAGVVVVDARIGDELDLSSAGKTLEHEEIAIAVHHIDGYAASGESLQGVEGGLIFGQHQIIAEPRFKEIAENVEGVGAGCRALEKGNKQPEDIRLFFREMKIGDEERGHTTSTFSITTGCTGTS